MPTQPRPDQMQAFIEQAPDGPIYMLNLLKFKAQAEYADDRETDLTGAQAYGLYGQGVGKLIDELGGHLVWSAQMNVMVIGDGEPEWDAIGIVEYPSIEAFQGMVASPAYQEVHVHRDAGLEHQLLINCRSQAQALGAIGASSD